MEKCTPAPSCRGDSRKLERNYDVGNQELLAVKVALAEVMINHVFRVHGFPKDIVSDRGPQFVSHFWREFCHLIGAKASMTSGYHPEDNGQTERISSWKPASGAWYCRIPLHGADYLVWVEFAHNTLPTSATGFSPFKCVFGYDPLVFADQEPEVSVPSATVVASGQHPAGASSPRRPDQESRGQKKTTHPYLPAGSESVSVFSCPGPSVFTLHFM